MLVLRDGDAALRDVVGAEHVVEPGAAVVHHEEQVGIAPAGRLFSACNRFGCNLNTYHGLVNLHSNIKQCLQMVVSGRPWSLCAAHKQMPTAHRGLADCARWCCRCRLRARWCCRLRAVVFLIARGVAADCARWCCRPYAVSCKLYAVGLPTAHDGAADCARWSAHGYAADCAQWCCRLRAVVLPTVRRGAADCARGGAADDCARWCCRLRVQLCCRLRVVALSAAHGGAAADCA